MKSFFSRRMMSPTLTFSQINGVGLGRRRKGKGERSNKEHEGKGETKGKRIIKSREE